MLLKGKGLKVNIHTHSSSENDNHAEIINLMPHEIPPGGLDEFKRYSVGIHPWYIDKDYEAQLQKVEELLALPNVIAVGEIGLDKICDTDFTLQEKVFKAQLQMAEKADLPAILHTVKTYSETLGVRKKFPGGTWIMHGFNANEYTAGELLKTDTYLSFGHLLLNNNARASRLFDLFPIQRILFETDEHEDIKIEDIYTEAAGKLGFDMHTLEQLIIKNFNTIFRNV